MRVGHCYPWVDRWTVLCQTDPAAFGGYSAANPYRGCSVVNHKSATGERCMEQCANSYHA